MLKQIICDKFAQPKIIFHKGLNAVIGDNVATNSIGKSTALMIIDFVFGGDDYITKNHDAVQNLGHHEFKFSFLFYEELFFIRSTNEYRVVSVCNDKFEVLEKIKINEYTSMLKEKYCIQIDDISFRTIVGRYFRVYGKENLNEKKPIQYFEKETQKASITALVMLFNKYGSIKDFEKQIETLTEEKNTLVNAAKKELIPKMTKTIFSKNQNKIVQLNQELETIKSNIINLSVDIEALITKDVLELRKHKSHLITQSNIFESRLNRTTNNILSKKIEIGSELTQLAEFFPDVNVERINEIDAFHCTITKILKEELQKTEKEIRDQIKQIAQEIETIDKKISAKLDVTNAPKYAINKVVEIAAEIKQLTDENGFYTKGQNIDGNIKKAKADLVDIKANILADIYNQINIRMNELNIIIYTDNRRAPVLTINDDKYIFNTFGDTGTGTAYANLITFDLAILQLTSLPALIHDLPLLKNIENAALENIVELYCQSQKQIFIAIDKINTYKSETAKLLEANEVLRLSKDKLLFILNWKKDDSKKKTQNDNNSHLRS